MGVIRKKTVTRGTEGGIKYICDVCSADITSTVRIRCMHQACFEYDLCVPCFAAGASSNNHNPATHPYSVTEQHSIPIYSSTWGADEELLLLEGAETYGLGSWADIADHIGGYRTREEVRDHYISTYIDSPNFPLPALADLNDSSLLAENPREVFQARKKRRIEDRKEAAKQAPPQQPKQKPTASVPACHEVQGFMPGRLEFESEYFNEAEEAVQSMNFEPGDGIDPRTGMPDPETELKMVVMDIYNSRLTARADRKRIIFEHQLLEYRSNAARDKKRTKEERDLFNKAKPYARIINHHEFVDLAEGVEYELNLRQAIGQMQEWRQYGISDLKSGEKYEAEKLTRLQKQQQGTGAFDRAGGVGGGGSGAGGRQGKANAIPETPSATIALTAPDLPERLKPSQGPSSSATALFNGNGKASLTNGTSNHLMPNGSNGNVGRPVTSTFLHQPLPGTTPLRLTPENATDQHLLTKDEAELCGAVKVMPKAYLMIKEALMREALKSGGTMRKRTARELLKVCSYPYTFPIAYDMVNPIMRVVRLH
ncbi:Transcriptional adapter ada2 [Agyrium rufum]|nr:Transcriptional adapter ada2 [Agyrium rufum]